MPSTSRKRLAAILDILRVTYPDAHCALHHRNPFELLVATMLSAQCTDKRVNLVTPALFEAFPHATVLASAPVDQVERLVASTGFFRTKARNLVGMAQALVDHHQAEVPASMGALVALPGVGRKTANVVLGNAFGIDEGIVVDTHVGRIAALLGFTRSSDATRIEADLLKLVPVRDRTLFSHLLIELGRTVCVARRPRCGVCPVRTLCPSARQPLTAAATAGGRARHRARSGGQP